MKKFLRIGLSVLLILSVLALSACGFGDVLKNSKGIVDAYYDAFSAGDIDAVIDLMHPTLIDSLGGYNEAVIFFSSIRAVHGEATDVSHTGFEIEGSKKNAVTDLTVSTSYENGNTTTDTFGVANEEGVYSIYIVDIPTAGTIEELSEAYKLAIISKNYDVLYQRLLPAVTNESGESDVIAFYEDAYSYYGDLTGVTDSEYYPNLYEEIMDGAYLVCVEYATFNTPQGIQTVELGYGVENGQLGVLSVNFLEE